MLQSPQDARRSCTGACAHAVLFDMDVAGPVDDAVLDDEVDQFLDFNIFDAINRRLVLLAFDVLIELDLHEVDGLFFPVFFRFLLGRGPHSSQGSVVKDLEELGEFLLRDEDAMDLKIGVERLELPCRADLFGLQDAEGQVLPLKRNGEDPVLFGVALAHERAQGLLFNRTVGKPFKGLESNI